MKKLLLLSIVLIAVGCADKKMNSKLEGKWVDVVNPLNTVEFSRIKGDEGQLSWTTTDPRVGVYGSRGGGGYYALKDGEIQCASYMCQIESITSTDLYLGSNKSTGSAAMHMAKSE